jgi:hypothetical protein
VARRYGLFVLAAPLVVLELLLRPAFPAYQDWADVATYTIVFLWGAVVFSDRAFEAVIRKEIGAILGVGIAAMFALGVTRYIAPQTYAWVGLVEAFAWAIYIWAWLHAVLYLGIRWFDFPSRAATYLQESVLPVYVIHHPLVLLVAGYVVTLGLGVWAKFGLIVTTVLILTLVTYEFGIRRWRITRAIFGLDPGDIPRRRGPLGRSPRAVRPLAAPPGG